MPITATAADAWSGLAALFAGVARASWQACVLAALVLLAGRVFGARLSARWRYNLWLLVVVRLVLPATPASRFSLFNAFNLSAAVETKPRSAGTLAAPAASKSASSDESSRSLPLPPLPPKAGATVARVGVFPERAPTPSPPIPSEPSTEPDVAEPSPVTADDGQAHGRTDVEAITAPVLTPAGPPPIIPPAASVPVEPLSPARPTAWDNVWVVAAVVWAAGCTAFGLWVGWASVAFAFTMRRLVKVDDPWLLAIAERCRRDLALRRAPPLLTGPGVIAPALVGWLRPRVLLPADAAGRLDERELRLVLLHEFTHLRRRDVAANWVLVGVQVVHWFNPLVWLVARRVRADRELACDEAVLAVAGRGDRQAYGRTLLKLLEGLSHGLSQGMSQVARGVSLQEASHVAHALGGPSVAVVGGGGPHAPPPVRPAGMVGILERDGRRNLIRRITMIARFDPAARGGRGWSVLAGVVAVALAGAALTDAAGPARPAATPPNVTPPAVDPAAPPTTAVDGVTREGPLAPPAVEEAPEAPEAPEALENPLTALPLVGRLFTPATTPPVVVPAARPVGLAPPTPRPPASENPAEAPPTPAAGGPGRPGAIVVRTPGGVAVVEPRAGDPGADDADAELARAQAQADLAKAKAAIEMADEDAKLKSASAARLKELHNQGAASAEATDQASAEAAMARHKVDIARAELAKAEATLKHAIESADRRGKAARPAPTPAAISPPRRPMGSGSAPPMPVAPAPALPPVMVAPPVGLPGTSSATPAPIPGTPGVAVAVPAPVPVPGTMMTPTGRIVYRTVTPDGKVVTAYAEPSGVAVAGGPPSVPGMLGMPGAAPAPAALVMRAYDVADLVEPNGREPADAQGNRLVQLVREMVNPEDWGRPGGGGPTISVFRSKLIVKTNESGHKEIAELLEMVRRDPKESKEAKDPAAPGPRTPRPRGASNAVPVPGSVPATKSLKADGAAPKPEPALDPSDYNKPSSSSATPSARDESAHDAPSAN